MTLTPVTEVLYKVDAPCSRESEGSVLWNDPPLDILWRDIGVEPVLFDKDRSHRCLPISNLRFEAVQDRWRRTVQVYGPGA